MAAVKTQKRIDEEQALIEKAKKLMEKARQLREQKVIKAGRAAEAFHKSGYKDIDKLQSTLTELFG